VRVLVEFSADAPGRGQRAALVVEGAWELLGVLVRGGKDALEWRCGSADGGHGQVVAGALRICWSCRRELPL